MYVIRALGGALFLVGALIMVFNIYKTLAPRATVAEAPIAPARRPRCPPNEETTHVRSHHQRPACSATRSSRRNSIMLLVGIIVAIAIGGIVEIVPLFYLKNTIEQVEGVRPYSPLELAGFNIYVREGCYLCHSQMIRPLRDEVERYGHYSLAAESMYDHPFQWGSKRNGPDLARVGGKYSDDWHRDHLRDPALVVPASIMPGYPFLEQTPLDYEHIAREHDGAVARRRALHAGDDRPRRRTTCARRAGRRRRRRRCVKRYPKAIVRDLGADKGEHHRGGRADRLSAAARHAGRLQALRRQGQHSLRRRTMSTYENWQAFAASWGSSTSRADLRRRLSATRSGHRARRLFDEAARMPLKED